MREALETLRDHLIDDKELSLDEFDAITVVIEKAIELSEAEKDTPPEAVVQVASLDVIKKMLEGALASHNDLKRRKRFAKKTAKKIAKRRKR